MWQRHGQVDAKTHQDSQYSDLHRMADQIALSGSIGNDNSLVAGQISKEEDIGHWIVRDGSHIEEEEEEEATMPLVVDGNRLVVAVEGTNIEEQKEGVDDGLIAIR